MPLLTTTIDEVLHHLLMEEAQVCLPGLGTLRRTARPAQLSPHERKAQPPSELVTFNVNLVLDDGRLLRELLENHDVDDTEAQVLMDDFLRNMRENLDAGRTFAIDGVGRFFKPFDGQIQFTPAGENFSKSSFGLPAVELVPIKRTEKQRRAAIDPMLGGAAAGAKVVEGAKVRKRRDWFRRIATDPTAAAEKETLLYNERLRMILWAVAILISLVLLYQLGQYFVGRAAGPATPVVTNEQSRDRVPQDRINVSPAPVDARTVAPDEPPRLNDPRRNQSPTNATTTTPPVNTSPVRDNQNTAVTSDNTALIATGMFGSQRNVEKNLDRLRAAGFETFARPEGNLTRIGAKLDYETEDELATATERLQRLFPDAFVMEVNGKRR